MAATQASPNALIPQILLNRKMHMQALPIANDFIANLVEIAPQTGHGTYAFRDDIGEVAGFIQLIPESQNLLRIHRIWSLHPRHGHGSRMLNQLCELADQHGITLKLKALPLGAKPYPFSRDELIDWYKRHGFTGRRSRLIREPQRTGDQSTRAVTRRFDF
jgi:GNAT superfamily N-acetyltransferase